MQDILTNLIIGGIHSATTIYTEENTVTERRDRPCWAVLIKYEGETVYLSKGKKYISNAENMMLLPKGSHYCWQCIKAGHYSVVEFDCNLQAEEIFSFPVKNGGRLLEIFKSIEQKRMAKKPFYQMESIQGTYAILLELLRASEQAYAPFSKRQRLFPAIDYIAGHYTERMTNDQLAALSGLSTVYFRKLFSEVYGVSPINYIIGLRIKKAKEMLRSDYSSITDIAVSLGYKNIYDFSRDFKKHVGISPSRYVLLCPNDLGDR